METQEFVVPRSIPMTGPETLELNRTDPSDRVADYATQSGSVNLIRSKRFPARNAPEKTLCATLPPPCTPSHLVRSPSSAGSSPGARIGAERSNRELGENRAEKKRTATYSAGGEGGSA